jgi:hypothetical protein
MTVAGKVAAHGLVAAVILMGGTTAGGLSQAQAVELVGATTAQSGNPLGYGELWSCRSFRPLREKEALGFSVGWLPTGLGPLVSDIEYEWGNVAFHSRFWESVRPTGGYQVDLHVAVLHGVGLIDQAAMRAFLAEYLEQDPVGWARDYFDHWGKPGFHTDSEAFWLAEPGVVMRVSLDANRFSTEDLIRTACNVRLS